MTGNILEKKTFAQAISDSDRRQTDLCNEKTDTDHIKTVKTLKTKNDKNRRRQFLFLIFYDFIVFNRIYLLGVCRSYCSVSSRPEGLPWNPGLQRHLCSRTALLFPSFFSPRVSPPTSTPLDYMIKWSPYQLVKSHTDKSPSVLHHASADSETSQAVRVVFIFVAYACKHHSVVCSKTIDVRILHHFYLNF